jgi:hypothetical protein
VTVLSVLAGNLTSLVQGDRFKCIRHCNVTARRQMCIPSAHISKHVLSGLHMSLTLMSVILDTCIFVAKLIAVQRSHCTESWSFSVIVRYIFTILKNSLNKSCRSYSDL